MCNYSDRIYELGQEDARKEAEKIQKAIESDDSEAALQAALQIIRKNRPELLAENIQ